MLKSSPSPRYSPTDRLSRPDVSRRNLATAMRSWARPQTCSRYFIPFFGFMLNLMTPSMSSALRWKAASKSTTGASVVTTRAPSPADDGPAAAGAAATSAGALAGASSSAAPSAAAAMETRELDSIGRASRSHATIESVMATRASSASALRGEGELVSRERARTAASCSDGSVSAIGTMTSRERPSHMFATMLLASRSQS